MKTYSRLTLALASVLFYASSYAEDIQFDFSSKHAQAAMEKYRATVTEVQERSRRDLIRDLEAAFKHERSDGDFDEAVKIGNAIKTLKENSVPPQGPRINNESLGPNTISDGEHISKLLVRDGLGYLPNTSQPYTGKCFDLYPSGQYRGVLTLDQGKAVSASLWYENGDRKAVLNFSEKTDTANLVSSVKRRMRYETISDEYLVSYLNGKCTFWHKNGQISCDSNYRNGEHADGTWVRWYGDGKKEREGNFRNGEKQGLFTSWYENGQKNSEGHYKNDKAEGLSTRWEEDGQKLFETHYKNGKLDGLSTSYLSNDEKWFETVYKNGEEVSRKEF